MKRIIFWIFCLSSLAGFSFAQDSSPAESNCALVNKTRDAFFIEFVRIEEKQDDKAKKENQIILRLRNNSTCPIELISSDVGHFMEKLLPNQTAQQVIERMRNPKWRTEIADDELIPALSYYTEFAFYTSLYGGRMSDGGDMVASFKLKGGNSILFAVPFENFKKRLLVLIPFDFVWETERRGYRGDTHHLVWFSYGSLPPEIKQKLKIK
jgi:hypothetical protein